MPGGPGTSQRRSSLSPALVAKGVLQAPTSSWSGSGLLLLRPSRGSWLIGVEGDGRYTRQRSWRTQWEDFGAGQRPPLLTRRGPAPVRRARAAVPIARSRARIEASGGTRGSAPQASLRGSRHSAVPAASLVDAWLILPVVICLSQRLSHACLSTDFHTVKPRMAH